MAEFSGRRKKSPLSHPGSVEYVGSDTASDVSSWAKGPTFATPDNLPGAIIQIQSSLRSIGLSGRINFLNGTPDDVAIVLNTIHNLLMKLQHEHFLKEDAQAEHRRLRAEAQTYDQNLTRLRKEIEVKERDIATLKIRSRQEVDRHAEELAIMIRDRDALQKHCNNLTRRQIQFQHEIRRKELQYEWLQEKLRNYLAERKRESTASMEIVGRLRQQSPQQSKEKNKLSSKIDDMMPGRNGGSKKNAARGPKLDENMVKMIVTAYEEKQRELMAENNDLQEALNSIRKEYTDLMNSRIENGEYSSRPPSRVDSKILTTRCDSVNDPHAPSEMKLPLATLPPRSATLTQSQPPALPLPERGEGSSQPLRMTGVSMVAYAPPPLSREELEEDIRRMAPIPDGVLNANHPDFVPWPIQSEISLRSIGDEDNEGNPSQAILDTAEHAPVLPPVAEEQEASDSVKDTPREISFTQHEEETIDAIALAEQSNLVLTSLCASVEKQPLEQLPESVPNFSEFAEMEVSPEVAETTTPEEIVPDTESLELKKEHGTQAVFKTEEMVIIPTDSMEEKTESSSKKTQIEEGSSESGVASMARSRSTRLAWPPRSPSPPPQRESPSPPRFRSFLGKLPQKSNKPVPNVALLTEEQLKTELRTRAVDVEEGVRALKAACTSMQPQHMRSVMEKRLHMELSMAANLAEQQEAVVNLALAGLERARRTAPSLEAELEDISGAVSKSLTKSEKLITQSLEMATDSEVQDQLRRNLDELMKELRSLKKKTTRSQVKETTSPDSSQELEKSISSLRERAQDLNRRRELIDKAKVVLEEKPNDPPFARRTWAEKAEDDKQQKETDELSPDVYSDDDSAPAATLSRILHEDDNETHS